MPEKKKRNRKKKKKKEKQKTTTSDDEDDDHGDDYEDGDDRKYGENADGIADILMFGPSRTFQHMLYQNRIINICFGSTSVKSLMTDLRFFRFAPNLNSISPPDFVHPLHPWWRRRTLHAGACDSCMLYVPSFYFMYVQCMFNVPTPLYLQTCCFFLWDRY